LERQITRPDGSKIWIKVDSSPTGAGEEATRDVILVLQDVSARHDAESQHRLLMGELSHRVKNTLAMVQAIATQTLRNASSPAEARTTLENRIMSLARAHDLLLQEHWAEASIRALIEGAIQFHKAERFRLSGPDLKVGPKGALSLALCLHELATNATKYGALSNEVGHIDLGWGVEETDARPHLVFSWIERGGPPVVEPTRKGFGSRLVQMGLSGEGEVTLAYNPAGLSCRMSAPLDTLQKS
jgi:two-component sensor histidine kinase